MRLIANRVIAAIGLVLVYGATHTRAGVTYDLVDRGVPTDGTTVASGFHAFTLRLTSDSGPITALDFSGANGIFGPIVQRWSSDNVDGAYDTPSPGFLTQQNLATSAGNFDSHFLLPYNQQGSASSAVAPNEDATIGAPGTRYFSFPTNSQSFGIGVGANLRAAYGILGAVQNSVLEVAYLVLQDGHDFSFSSQIATRNGTFLLSGGISNQLIWNPPSSEWNSNSSNQNWLTAAGSGPFNSGANVAFTDAGLTGGGTVHVDPAGVHVGNVDFSNTTGTYILSGGAIDAIGRLTKSTAAISS